MALGRAFIEVHADLRPFKKDLGRGVAALLKETQRAVDKAVKDGLTQAEESVGGKRGRKIKITPELDTTNVDRDSDRVAKGLRGAVQKGLRGGWESFMEALNSPGKTFDLVTIGLIAAAAAPVIGAMLSGAIVAAIGAAGIGTAVALTFRDPRIKEAGKDLVNFIFDGFTEAADVFLVPVYEAIGQLKDIFADIFDDFQRGFAHLAPYLDDLVGGFGGFLRELSSGLESAFRNAGPFIQIVAQYLPEVGYALAYMMEVLSESAGARAGLTAFFIALIEIIYLVTDALKILSESFLGFLIILNSLPDFLLPDQLKQDLDDMISSVGRVPEVASPAIERINTLGNSAFNASGKARELTASLNEFFGAQLGWVDANIRFEESIDAITESFRRNGDTLNINTAKGRENVRAVNDGIKAAIAARDAKIKETGSVAAGNAVYATHIARLRSVLKNAGLTKTEIEKLIGAYDEVPEEVNTDVNAPGLSDALRKARELRAELARLERMAKAPGGKGGDYTGVGGYADGGVVTRQQLAWVGEGNKPEAIVPLTNPTRAAEVMAEAGLLGMGGGTIVVQLVLDGEVIDERIVRYDEANARRIQHQPRAVI